MKLTWCSVPSTTTVYGRMGHLAAACGSQACLSHFLLMWMVLGIFHRTKSLFSRISYLTDFCIYVPWSLSSKDRLWLGIIFFLSCLSPNLPSRYPLLQPAFLILYGYWFYILYVKNIWENKHNKENLCSLFILFKYITFSNRNR